MIQEKLFALTREIEAACAKCEPGPERDELIAQLADLQLASQSIATRQGARREAAERAKKHALIVPQCRTALDQVKQLVIDQAKAEETLLIADGYLSGCEERERQALDAKPQPQSYPTRLEMGEWAKSVSGCEAAVAAARLARKKAVTVRDEIVRTLFDAKKKLDAFQFQERMVRPASANPELIETGGTLSAVR